MQAVEYTRENRFFNYDPCPASAFNGAAGGGNNAQVQAPQSDGKSGWSFGGLLTGKPTLSASGMAAYGSGINAVKGIYKSDSSISFITPALGLAASADTALFSISYQGSSIGVSPVTVEGGFTGQFHWGFGGRVSVEFTGSSFNFSIDGGVGAGAGFYIYSIGKDFKEH